MIVEFQQKTCSLKYLTPLIGHVTNIILNWLQWNVQGGLKNVFVDDWYRLTCWHADTILLIFPNLLGYGSAIGKGIFPGIIFLIFLVKIIFIFSYEYTSLCRNPYKYVLIFVYNSRMWKTQLYIYSITWCI